MMEGVITVSEPQVWTLIAVFGSGMFTMMGIVSTLFVRVVKAEIGVVRTEIGAVGEALGTRIEYLDRDVQAISAKIFGRSD